MSIMSSDNMTFYGPKPFYNENYDIGHFLAVAEGDMSHASTVLNVFNKIPLSSFQIRTYDFDFHQLNTELGSDIYVFQSRVTREDTLAQISTKFPMINLDDEVLIETSGSFQVDIQRDRDNRTIIKPFIIDEFNNRIHFSTRQGPDYYQKDMQFVITNKDTKEVITRTYSDYGQSANLQDGRYTIELLDESPQNLYDVQMKHKDYVVKDYNLYLDRGYNTPVEVVQESLTYSCNVGDVFILDLSKIFFDADGDKLYYDVDVDTNHFFTASGFKEQFYFNKATEVGNMTLKFFATDMYGVTKSKVVTIEVQ